MRHRRLTLDAIFDSKRFDEPSLNRPKWFRDGKTLTFLDKWPDTELNTVWRLDTDTGVREPVFDPRDLRFEGDDEPRKVHAVTWSTDEQRLFVTSEAPARFKPCGDVFVFDLEQSRWTRLTDTTGAQYHPKLSHDGAMIGLVRDNDLYVLDVGTGAERRLTTDGSEALYNGRGGWVYEEELGFGDTWQWSPDGQTIAYVQQDESAVPEVLLSRYDDLHCSPRRTRYPKAGDPNPTVRLGLMDVGSGYTRWVDLAQPEPEHYIAHIQWSPNGEALLVQYLPRLQNTLRLLRIDPVTAAVATVIEETDEAWVDHPGQLRFLGKGARFVWPSDRDGWRRLYLYDLSGVCHGCLTEGSFDVDEVLSATESPDAIVYAAASPDPTQRTLWRVSAVGGAPQPIATGRGRHWGIVSECGSRYVHAHSALNTPTSVVVRSTDGRELCRPIAGSPPRWDAYGVHIEPSATASAEPSFVGHATGPTRWEMLTFATSDGERLHGRIMLPYRFDPARRYPVLMHTYGGPGSQVVTDQWGGKGPLWYHLLAREGYVVFLCDNRGTGGRGRQFRKQTYLRLGHWEVKDQLEGVRYLRGLPFVDPGRIALWGWSYGGYMAALTLLRSEGLLKAAVAVAPVTDWRLYDTIYTERYMRRPEDNPEGYRDGSPVTYASDLKGRLLIIHGTMDDNVHFQHAARLMSALQDAKLAFEVMVYPGKHHGIEDRHLHLYRMMTDWLRRSL